MRHAAFSPRLESCLWTCGLFREFNKDLCPGELYSLWWEIKWIIDKWKSFSQQVQLKLLDVTDRISCASRMWIPRQAPGRGSCEPGVKQGKRKKKKTGRRYPSCESEFPGYRAGPVGGPGQRGGWRGSELGREFKTRGVNFFKWQ